MTTEESVEEEELTEEEMEVLNTLLDTSDSSETWGPKTLRYFGPKTRTILVTGEIDEELANAICSQVYELNSESGDEPICVHINTPGGSIIDALAIYDVLRCVTNPIITVVHGGCFSAGLLIACAGDQRIATPNSMYFYHQPTLQMLGVDSMLVMESNRGFYEWCKHNSDRIMRDRIDMPEEAWEETFGHKTSLYFNVEEAIKYGFCTGQLKYQDKPKIIFEEEEEEECELSE